MCSNLLEKISKEERESESGGKEGCGSTERELCKITAQRESCVRSLNSNGLPNCEVRT